MIKTHAQDFLALLKDLIMYSKIISAMSRTFYSIPQTNMHIILIFSTVKPETAR